MALADERQIKREIFEHLAQFNKAFGSARRLQIIELLAQSEFTVEQMAEESGMSVANTSQHLKILRSNRLVAVRRQGVEAFYRLADESVFSIWDQLRSQAENRIGDIEKLAGRLHGDDPADYMAFTELLPLMHQSRVMILDVRPAGEYHAGHIPSALCIPLENLSLELPDIHTDGNIIVYCRGPYSTLSSQAVMLLRTKGYQARRLEKGFPQWRAADLPVTASNIEKEFADI